MLEQSPLHPDDRHHRRADLRLLLERIPDSVAAHPRRIQVSGHAGIKNAPADDKYQKLNTSNLTSLLESAKLLGYDIEVVGI